MNDNDSNSSGFWSALAILLFVLSLVLKVVAQWQRINEPHAAQQQREDEHRQQMMDNWWAQQRNMEQVRAIQSEYGLSDKDMSELLQPVWKQNHPGKESAPWNFRLGDMKREEWWTLREWDPEQVRQACEQHVASLE